MISISYDLTITRYDTYLNIGTTLTHVCFVENKIVIIIQKYYLFSFKKMSFESFNIFTNNIFNVKVAKVVQYCRPI
jgi:hypothetical protein